MKRLSILLAVSLLMTIMPAAGIQAATSPAVYINGMQMSFEASPIVSGERVLVPMRDIFESLGASVNWDGDKQVVEASKGTHRIILTVGSLLASKDGANIQLDVEPVSWNGHVMIPLRFVAEALDDRVEWMNDSNSVYIYSPDAVSSLESQTYARSKYVFPYKAPRTATGYQVRNYAELVMALKAGMTNFETPFKLDCQGYDGDAFNDFKSALAQAQKELQREICFFSIYNEVAWEQYGSVISVNIEYMVAREQFESTRQKVSEIAAEVVRPGMSDADIEKAFHDYLVNNCVYDLTFAPPSYTAYGALILGRAVCQGYSEAMGMLCLHSGIECMLVTGSAYGDGVWAQDHAWNLVNVNGVYRHVDVTYDDPISWDGRNNLTYEYYNKTDQQIDTDHDWVYADYPAAQ